MCCQEETYGHTAMNLAVEALTIAGTDERAALRDALEKVQCNGIMGQFIYSPTDHDGITGDAFDPIIIKDGKWFAYKK